MRVWTFHREEFKLLFQNGKPSLNKVIKRLQHFMDECFINDDGTFKDVNYEKCRTKKDCKRLQSVRIYHECS